MPNAVENVRVELIQQQHENFNDENSIKNSSPTPNNTVIVSWTGMDAENANGMILSYRIVLEPIQKSIRTATHAKMLDVSSNFLSAGNKTQRQSVKINGLHHFTAYHVYVTAFTVIGEGRRSAEPPSIQTPETSLLT